LDRFSGSWDLKSAGQHALWKLPQRWKSIKVAFGNFFFMISTTAWKSLRKKRSGFPTVPTAPTTVVKFRKQKIG